MPPVLSGIAEQNGPEGVVRTAILTEPDGTIRFALVGQTLREMWRVAAIESDRMVMVNGRTGLSSELVLK